MRILQETGEHGLNENGRLGLHYAAFLCIYVLYGYQVCPFLDDLSLTEISLPVMVAIAAHFVLRSTFKKAVETTKSGNPIIRMFYCDWALFVVAGLCGALFNFVQFGFPPGSGGKVIVGFAVLGLYISLDLALRRDLAIAKHMKQQGRDYPLSDQFLPFQTKFMLFSAINVVVMAMMGVLVALKDLVWARNASLTDKEVQLLILMDTVVVVGIIGIYIMLTVRQYSRKIAFSLEEETSTLNAVQNGQLSSRVAITSNDEFGQLAHLTNGMIARLNQSLEEVARNKTAIIQALVSLAAKRDNETGMHLARTQMFVRLLAEELRKSPKYSEQLNPETVKTIVDASPLHDIGKVGVPDAILRKPGRLTADEFEVMQTHTTIGAEALREANTTLGGSDFISTAIDIAEYHHEKWNGTGYPHGIKDEDIPLSARIMAVADVYDAIRAKRIYKPARPHGDAKSIILDGSGDHFDPDVVDAFLKVEGQFAEITEHYQDGVDNAQEPLKIAV